ncbi:uncharacterized protein LOC134098466 [Sardina pilchardus]|uniref:uncharacterized protein LOC134098466 n=1 Tax=Sardina pilchardus TaxID=27697 RepID=UPI002E11717D
MENGSSAAKLEGNQSSVPSNGLCLPANQQLALSTVLSTVYRQFSASGQSAVWIVDSFLGQSAARIIYSFLNYGSNESVFTDSRRCSRGTTTGTSGGSGLSSGGGSGGSASVSDSAGPSSSGGGSSSGSSYCGAYRPGADSSSKGGRDTGSSTGCGSTGACSASAVTATGAITACPLSCCPGRTTNSCCSCNRTFSCYTASPPGPLNAPADCEGAPHPPPPPNAPSDNASPTRPPSAAGRRTSRRPSGACTAAAGQDSKDNKQCRQHLLLSLSLHTKLNRRGGRGLSRGQRHSRGQSPLPGPACHKCRKCGLPMLLLMDVL